jgi:hypothetical protein
MKNLLPLVFALSACTEPFTLWQEVVIDVAETKAHVLQECYDLSDQFTSTIVSHEFAHLCSIWGTCKIKVDDRTIIEAEVCQEQMLEIAPNDGTDRCARLYFGIEPSGCDTTFDHPDPRWRPDEQ